MDAIDKLTDPGKVTGRALAPLKNLKSLRLSLILSKLGNAGGKELIEGLKQLSKLEELTLVLMGDELSLEFGKALKEYLLGAKDRLKLLSLNLFSNKFGAEGIQPIGEGIQQLTKLQSLELDLYFNNLTETGAKSVSEGVSALTQLKELRLNLDFNGITNEGGEHVGNALSKLQNLEVLDLGVATKNFGYLGYKHVVEGLQTLTKLRKLNLRCGVNKVGINGASVTAQAFARLPELE